MGKQEFRLLKNKPYRLLRRPDVSNHNPHAHVWTHSCRIWTVIDDEPTFSVAIAETIVMLAFFGVKGGGGGGPFLLDL